MSFAASEKLSRYLLLAMSLALVSLPVIAEDEEEDDIQLTYDDKLQSCAACHGENGDKPLAPDYPVLAGQYQDYLAESLKAYRDGRRSHPIMTMQVQVLKLTDEDIEKLATHYASKKGLVNLGD